MYTVMLTREARHVSPGGSRYSDCTAGWLTDPVEKYLINNIPKRT